MKKNTLKFLSLALVMFFIIVSGGCGGGGSGSGGGANDDVEIPTNPVPENQSAARAETVLNLDLSSLKSANSISFDSDGSRGLPDFLDFYGIPQIHVNNSASDASVTAASEVSTADAKGVSVPSMVWLNKLNL